MFAWLADYQKDWLRRDVLAGLSTSAGDAATLRTEFLWALAATAGVLLLGTLKGILVAILVSLVALSQQVAEKLRPLAAEAKRSLPVAGWPCPGSVPRRTALPAGPDPRYHRNAPQS